MTMALTQVSDNGLTNTGVTAATYGSSSAIPSLTIDAKGRVTSASTSAIDSTSIANGTSNVSVASGGDITVTRAGSTALTFTGNGPLLPDSQEMRFGNGADLRIYHDSSNSYIADLGSGSLFIRGSDLVLEDAGGNDYITCSDNGTGGTVTLKHLGSAKLTTKSDGVDITGELQCDTLDVDGAASFTGGDVDYNGANYQAFWDYSQSSFRFQDNATAEFGTGEDLRIYHNATNSYIENQNGDLYVQTTGSGDDVIVQAIDDIFIKPRSGENGIQVLGDGAVKLAYNNDFKFETTSSGVNITGTATCDGVVVDGSVDIDINSSSEVTSIDSFILNGGNNKVAIKCHANQGGDPYIFFDAGGTNFVVGEQYNGGTSNLLRLGAGSNMGSVTGIDITAGGDVLPTANNTMDLGTSAKRWRNIYTNDMNLSNEGSVNDVDGTWGSYTIQEGEDDLFLINRRSGKKYKFNLTEVN